MRRVRRGYEEDVMLQTREKCEVENEAREK